MCDCVYSIPLNNNADCRCAGLKRQTGDTLLIFRRCDCRPCLFTCLCEQRGQQQPSCGPVCVLVWMAASHRAHLSPHFSIRGDELSHGGGSARPFFFFFFFSFLELATRHATHSNGGLALLSLNLTGGMRLVGTQARGCPPLFMAHRSVSALIIIKPSLLQIKGWPARAALPLSHEAQEELTGLCARACPGKNFIILFT